MKTTSSLSYRKRLQGRRALLYLLLVYMVLVGELGGDSRTLTPLARGMSRLLLFGGMGYVIYLLVRIKKLLRDDALRAQARLQEQDERNRLLHEKSGGAVWDVQFFALVFLTCTAGMFDMAAFYATFAALLVAVALKVGSYLFYRTRL